MPGFRVGVYDEWPTLGWEIVDWIEAYLCHGPGDVEGEPLALDDEWVRFLLDCYRLHPRDHERAGRRVVTAAVLSRPKGRAKSELAGAIVCAEGLGPVRFDGWNAGGDPVGRPIRSPFIRCLATEESQAGNTYDNVTVMLDHAAEHHADVFGGVDIGKSAQASTRIYLPNGGEIRPSTASSAAKDGGKETFSVADETHLYVLPEHRAMHRTVSRNLRKRKLAEPWLLNTTTMYRPGQGSIAEGQHTRAQELREGRRRLFGGFYCNHREGSEVVEFDDDDQVLASLHEAYGEAASWVDLEVILSDEIRSPEATEADSRRYWLNQLHAGSGAAFDVVQWAELAAPRDIPGGTLVTLGLAGARFGDGMSLIATAIADGYQWPVGIWDRPVDVPADTDWQVSEEIVEAAVVDAFERFTVWRMYANPPYWESAIDRWAGRFGNKRIIRWWISRTRAMAFAVRAYDTSIKTGELTHDGSAGFAAGIGHCTRRDTNVKDEQGRAMWILGKEHAESSKTIHPAVAGCLSWEARGDAIAAGVLNEDAPAELVSF